MLPAANLPVTACTLNCRCGHTFRHGRESRFVLVRAASLRRHGAASCLRRRGPAAGHQRRVRTAAGHGGGRTPRQLPRAVLGCRRRGCPAPHAGAQTLLRRNQRSLKPRAQRRRRPPRRLRLCGHFRRRDPWGRFGRGRNRSGRGGTRPGNRISSTSERRRGAGGVQLRERGVPFRRRRRCLPLRGRLQLLRIRERRLCSLQPHSQGAGAFGRSLRRLQRLLSVCQLLLRCAELRIHLRRPRRCCLSGSRGVSLARLRSGKCRLQAVGLCRGGAARARQLLRQPLHLHAVDICIHSVASSSETLGAISEA